MDLHNVGLIPNSDVCLVSLGQLLACGAKVHGDDRQITVTYGDGTILAPFTPGRVGHGLYTIEALPLKGQCAHIT